MEASTDGPVARLLGLHAAVAYYNSLPEKSGLAACADHVLADHGFDIEGVWEAAQCIPQKGALLICSNHPTGVLDGVLLLSALLSRRSDVRIVANDVLCCIPVLADRIIPIKKTAHSSARDRQVLMAIRSAWKRDECVIAFPAGTVAHWQWRSKSITDAPWTDGIQRLASKLDVPEYRALLAIENPLWYHGLAAISRKARTGLLLRAFLGNTRKQPRHPVTFHAVQYEMTQDPRIGLPNRSME